MYNNAGLRGRVWGVDNREAPLRLCVNAGRASRNWEVKSLDATANPHLALSALIAAGCAVRARLRLTPSCQVTRTGTSWKLTKVFCPPVSRMG